mgnify:CR=1 FL=1
MKIIVTGSEGLLGKEIVKHLEKNYDIIKLDLISGEDLTDESFVKKWFKKNHASSLVNCFAINDHVEKGKKSPTLFDITLKSFSHLLDTNLVSLFSVCREFARNNKSGSIINFSATTGIVSARPDLYNGGHKHIGYSVSKAGVLMLTKHLAVHLAPNIRVNSIIPGGIEIPRQKNLRKNTQKKLLLEG